MSQNLHMLLKLSSLLDELSILVRVILHLFLQFLQSFVELIE